jgi:NADPH2:quinone reductase
MTAKGGPDVLQLRDVEKPEIESPTQILVRLQAAGINPLDTKIRQLNMFYPNVDSAILGCDGAGVVEAIGSSVQRFRVGEEVYFFNNGLGGAPGCYAQYTVIDQAYAARKPSGLTMVEAAAAPLVLITAWQALVDRVGLQAGEQLLVHAGAGGVGHIAIQLARWIGARVAATVSGAEKVKFIENLGAELAIDYKARDFVDETLAWTEGRGSDVTFDAVGGSTFCRSFLATCIYGRITTLLTTACEAAELNKARLRNLVIGYVQMTTPLYLGLHEARCHQTHILEEGTRLFDEGKLRVKVSNVFPLRSAAEAHRLVEAGHLAGKVVLQID